MSKKSYFVLGGITLTIIGFIVIPTLIKNFSAKMYKSSLKKSTVDFDNLGPEIISTKNKDFNEGEI